MNKFFSVFYSGDIILMTIFVLLILLSCFNWFNAGLKFHLLSQKRYLHMLNTTNFAEFVEYISKISIDEYNLKSKVIESTKNIIIENETKLLSKNLNSFASSASVAPFVGLFGTVWGIYNALIDIAKSGSASLDVVAGPVGEALVATAVGLFVAIPASILYNYFCSKIEDIVHQRNNNLEAIITNKFLYNAKI